MEFDKYHGLGNDYIVIPRDLTAEQVVAICTPHFGVGSDGILVGPLPSEVAGSKVLIYNPDGSRAEKSGNGARIYSRHLRELGLVKDNEPFTFETEGGILEATVFDGGKMVQVDMGKVTFQTLNGRLTALDRDFTYNFANIGNPHCVIILDEINPELAKKYGYSIEHHPLFLPNRTNVQFMKVLDRNNIQLEIWERGAEYTLASGSSSCAAGAVARRLKLCDADITSHMPGGDLLLHVSDDYAIRQTGSVTKVMSGRVSEELF